MTTTELIARQAKRIEEMQLGRGHQPGDAVGAQGRALDGYRRVSPF